MQFRPITDDRCCGRDLCGCTSLKPVLCFECERERATVRETAGYGRALCDECAETEAAREALSRVIHQDTRQGRVTP